MSASQLKRTIWGQHKAPTRPHGTSVTASCRYERSKTPNVGRYCRNGRNLRGGKQRHAGRGKRPPIKESGNAFDSGGDVRFFHAETPAREHWQVIQGKHQHRWTNHYRRTARYSPPSRSEHETVNHNAKICPLRGRRLHLD